MNNSSMRMGKDVIKVITELIASNFRISEEEAGKKIKQLEESKRLIKELWG